MNFLRIYCSAKYIKGEGGDEQFHGGGGGSRLHFLSNSPDFLHEGHKCVIFFFLEKKFEIFFLGHLFWPFEIFPFYTSWSHALVFWKIFLIFSIKARSVWYFIFLEKKCENFFGTPFFANLKFLISNFWASRLHFLSNFLDFLHEGHKFVIFFNFGKKNSNFFFGTLFLAILFFFVLNFLISGLCFLKN